MDRVQFFLELERMISAPTRDPTLGGTLLSLPHDLVRHRSMQDAGESEGGFLELEKDAIVADAVLADAAEVFRERFGKSDRVGEELFFYRFYDTLLDGFIQVFQIRNKKLIKLSVKRHL